MTTQTQTPTVEMNWFELDSIRANIPEENSRRSEVVDMMDRVVDGGTVALDWWQLDGLAQAATGEKGDELREIANDLC